MPRFLCRFLLAMAMVCAVVAPASAQSTLRAAAVVNDEVISALDLEMRLRLVMLSSGMRNSQQARQRLTPQVLRTLIDERLQLQEAERLGVEVSDEEVQEAIGRIAQNNNMDAERFLGALERERVMPQSLRNQVRARLAWQKVVGQRLRSDVEIGEEEVDAVVERIRSNEGQTQIQVAEIFLAVDDPDQEDEVRGTARRLIQQLRNGANFAALARQFSQAATAAVGGDLGWIQPGRLPDELTSRLRDMQPGQIAGPVRTYSGYYIVQLRNRRTITSGDLTLKLSQLYLSLPSNPDQQTVQELTATAEGYADRLNGCEELRTVSEQQESAVSGDLGEVRLGELPEKVRTAVADLDVGQPSRPVRVNGGIVVLMVCDRQEAGIDRDEIRQGLMQERLGMLARRYLRDLRREAHVDIRL